MNLWDSYTYIRESILMVLHHDRLARGSNDHSLVDGPYLSSYIGLRNS